MLKSHKEKHFSDDGSEASSANFLPQHFDQTLQPEKEEFQKHFSVENQQPAKTEKTKRFYLKVT